MIGLFSLIADVFVWLLVRLSRGRMPELVAVVIVCASVVAMLNLLFTVPPTITLTCTREETADVYCRYDTRLLLLGGISGGIQRVQRAVNERGLCSQSNCSYRIVLETAAGRYPLSDKYSSGSKADFVDRLNSFIADRSQASIKLTQSPDLSGVLFPFSLMVVVAVLVFGRYWLIRKGVQNSQ